MLNKFKYSSALLALTLTTQALALSDDFTQAVVNDSTAAYNGGVAPTSGNGMNWTVISPACLTAGTSTNNSTTAATTSSTYSSIPGCNLTTPDAAGSGALRLTDTGNNEAGAIISNGTFALVNGIQVTFTTYTYGGTGADGIGFFLQDAAVPTTLPFVGGTTGTIAANLSGTISTGLVNIGESGGSLGYSCSNYKNYNWNGLTGGYIGLGMDEYGNFTNGASGGSHNDNTATGSGFSPNTISLRGKGDVSWYWLHTHYPYYYPTTLTSTKQQAAVEKTCQTGTLWNYHNSNSPSNTNATSNTGNGNDGSVLYDYPAIPGSTTILPTATQPINSTSTTRSGATPITYKLILNKNGYLTFMYNYNGTGWTNVLTNFQLTASNGPLPTSGFRFGFLGSTGGATDTHEITCFAAQPLESASSASSNAIHGASYHTNTHVYFTSYNNNDWSGSVVSAAVTQGTNSLSVDTFGSYTWDADCALTGGTCASTGSTTNASAMATTARQLLTWDAITGGIALESANITAAQTIALNTTQTSPAVTDTGGANRLDWLRGGRSNELTATPTPGLLRARSGVLGDIINSSPTWVGPPSAYNFATFTDAIYGGTPAEATHPYSTAFSGNSTAATRLNVVYVGSNDGMVHGFEAGSYATDGVTFSSTNNDGKEVIGFMPSGVLSTATTSPNTAPNIVSLTAPTYGHNYFVDATPGTGDLYYNGAWHTWLVGGLGEGGAEIYALDVTKPSLFSETNAASLVIGDWNALGANMGKSYGTPIIRRLHNGKWAIIFGNGINSTNQHAGVFIGVISNTFTPPATSANITFYFLDTGTGSSTAPDGISYVTSVDLDGDHIADYLYAGDLLGNVWRFDLTSKYVTDWKVSTYGQASATPLFTATDSSGTAQPITSSIVATSTYTGGSYRIILGFGTGQATPFATGANPPVNTYSTGQQTAYGIWDWDFNDWNNGRTITETSPTPNLVIPGSAAQYASLPEVISTGPTVYRSIARSNLKSNSVTSQSNPVYDNNGNVTTAGSRTVAVSTVNWCSTTVCTSTSNQYGWLFDLPDSVSNTSACGTSGGTCHEQIVFNPVFVGGDMLVNTTTPPASMVGQCSMPYPQGWTMSFNMASGGENTNGAFFGSGASGVGIGASGSPYILNAAGSNSAPGTVSVVSNGYNGTGTSSQNGTPQGGVTVKRVSWGILR